MSNIKITGLWILIYDPLKKFLSDCKCDILWENINQSATLVDIEFFLNDDIKITVRKNYIVFKNCINGSKFAIHNEDFSKIWVI